MRAPHCSHIDVFSRFNPNNERKTYYVLLLTAVTMVIEIIAGSVYGSMALLADGWHMGTHAAAFCITLFTYRYARQHKDSRKYSYGTGKVSVLGGYSSAVGLGLVAIVMLFESLYRFIDPVQIHFTEAMIVASIGLLVNVVSVFLLHDHDHDHDHDHHSHHDHNLNAAYMHVLADALTSILAIAALLIGKFLGWVWLDPVMGMVGAVVITRWAIRLMKQTAPVLLDESIDRHYAAQVLQKLEALDADVTDMHIWRVSADHFAASICLNVRDMQSPGFFKRQLAEFGKIHHLTIEVNHI
ncbi:CDF family Co(II)/Ni(II) efflux transporter DmeF [Vibrio rhizosphaerae]|uniref:CDF family Co(II)/Ni(II) efflux transporter DmeF n=1 Tax=Vibrio rhizosphaerae TaxID=398736 RepID=A0ABU4IYN7_9VIBR|nr:CDF family Co(II)/Ni(II) efflux transporter DmeF [Vibrio rhizosphaerae]MDW6094505.1 CDF family Co(II)/Ni(II) efflux transporter DmeF [Vibrio rhizosphaerae]